MKKGLRVGIKTGVATPEFPWSWKPGLAVLGSLKALANGLALLLVLPAVLGYYASQGVLGRERAFPGWSQLISLLPGMTGCYLRRAFYRLVLARCDEDATISFGTIFSHATAAVGRNVYIGPFGCLGDVTLEEDVLLGSHVSLMNGNSQHGIESLEIPIQDQPGVWVRVTVGKDTWIGDRAIVMADIGKHCVIGAGSVVTKPIPDYAIAVGNPARVLRYRGRQNSGSEPCAASQE